MLPWIQVYSNLADHPKIYALVDRMKLRRNSEAVGIVVSLWLWAAKNAPDGDLSGFPERAIADAVGYSSSYAKKLCQVLVETRWLDETENGYALHDWVEYAPAIIDMYRRDKNRSRERSRQYRLRKKEESAEENVSYVTNHVTRHVTDAVTNANRHAPRLDKTTEDKIREDHMSSSEASSWSKSKLNSLFSPQLSLSESALEELLSLADGMEEGLLLQSLEIARDNGKLNWGYVRGILRNWQKNRVKTLGEFKEWEARRKVNKSGGNPSIHVPGAQDVAESRRRMEQLREELKGEGP